MFMKFSIICFLCLSFFECQAGRVYVDLTAFDHKTNALETPCAHDNMLAVRGVKVVVSFDRQTGGQEDILWNSDIIFTARKALTGDGAPKVFDGESAIKFRYMVYGALTTEESKGIYRGHFGLPATYPFPESETSPFYYGLDDRLSRTAEYYRGRTSLKKRDEHLTLFRFVLEDKNFSIQNLIESLRDFKGGGNLPRYCGKGFAPLLTPDDGVLNCITFATKFFDHLGINVRSDPFIESYLNNTSRWKKIAYPDRFLESLANVCRTEGGTAYRGNISNRFNTYYYNTPSLRALLEPAPSPATKINGHMIIVDDPAEDGRSLGEKSFVKADAGAAVGIGVVGAGVGGVAAAVGGGAVGATGIAATIATGATGVATAIATGGSSVAAFLGIGSGAAAATGATTAAGSAVALAAGPVILGAAAVGVGVGAAGYGVYRIGKWVVNKF